MGSSISIQDITMFGFKFKIESNAIWHFEKGKGINKLFLMYHPESGYLKIRKDWKHDYLAVFINGLHIKSNDELNFVMSRLPISLHLLPQ